MKKSTTTITVLDNFNGMHANVVETVQRTTTKRGGKVVLSFHGTHTTEYFREVSYKGSRYRVFKLNPEQYGIESANCISINR